MAKVQVKVLRRDTFNGVDGSIIHVDPDNKTEGGRYSSPELEHADAAVGVARGSIEIGARADRKSALAAGTAFFVEPEAEANRLEAVAELEHDTSTTTPLSTQQTVNFPSTHPSRNDEPGGDGIEDDDVDAPRAPGTSGPAERGAAGTDGRMGGAPPAEGAASNSLGPTAGRTRRDRPTTTEGRKARSSGAGRGTPSPSPAAAPAPAPAPAPTPTPPASGEGSGGSGSGSAS
jgi:hypothetical protein